MNDDLPDNPELINEDPTATAGWSRSTIGDKTDLEDLMTADEYRKFIEESATE